MTKQKSSLQEGNLTFGQKAAIAKHYAANPLIKQHELAEWARAKFNLTKAPDRTTISRTLKRKQEFETLASQDLSIKRTRVVTHEILENALSMWVLQMQHQRLAVSADVIKEKGRRYATELGLHNPPKFSNGWL